MNVYFCWKQTISFFNFCYHSALTANCFQLLLSRLVILIWNNFSLFSLEKFCPPLLYCTCRSQFDHAFIPPKLLVLVQTVLMMGQLKQEGNVRYQMIVHTFCDWEHIKQAIQNPRTYSTENIKRGICIASTAERAHVPEGQEYKWLILTIFLYLMTSRLVIVISQRHFSQGFHLSLWK